MVPLCWSLKLCDLLPGMLCKVSYIVGDRQGVRWLALLCFNFFYLRDREDTFFLYFIVNISLSVNEMLHKLLISMTYLYNNRRKTVKLDHKGNFKMPSSLNCWFKD